MAENLVPGDLVIKEECFIKSKRGTPTLVDKFKFEYLFNREKSGRRYWCCRLRRTSEKCPGSAITTVKGGGRKVSN